MFSALGPSRQLSNNIRYICTNQISGIWIQEAIDVTTNTILF